jgi:hypothetical protein
MAVIKLELRFRRQIGGLKTENSDTKKANRYWTCSITRLVIEQARQNTPHFAVFKRLLFRN